jgi:cyclopropane-fatty-acyl-phospholipid synthase
VLFARMLRHIVRRGSLRFIDHAGREHFAGDGSPPALTVRSASRRLDRMLTFRPTLLLGEAYMNGGISIEQGTLYDFLALLASQDDGTPTLGWLAVVARLRRRLRHYNPVGIARLNVAHHYDLSDELYQYFLDSDRQYSCAYFRSPSDTLEQAQTQKKQHIAAKMLLNRPGLRVLDIGSGWGGLGLFLASEAETDVTGVTLSVSQEAVSNARARQAGLGDRVRFQLCDYRQVTGPFDRIVSVGMFEHVGKRNYDEFFAKLRALLADDGIAVVHAIGYADTPGPIDPFIAKYIFPGADLASLSEVFAAVERSGLVASDVEILQLHYAETLARWRERFLANRQAVAELYDERFCRMWEYYLALCEVGFRFRTTMVFQIVLARHKNALPFTRDHMFEWERAH